MALKSGRVGIHPSQVDPITGMLLSGPSGTSDYEQLSNLPKVNSVTLKGNKSLSDLGIPTSLAGQSDTDITNPEQGQTLQYNGTGWENVFASIAPTTLAALQDVDITDPQDGDYLVYDDENDKWVNSGSAPTPTYTDVTCIFYGAVEDIISFTDAAGVSHLVTFATDASSKQETFKIDPSGSSIIFTSAVAKNPDNLSEPFSKTVTITSATTDIEIFPVAKSKMLYWYGYQSDNLEIMSTANGWPTLSSTGSYTSPTFNKNDISLTTSTSTFGGVGTKNVVSASKWNMISVNSVANKNTALQSSAGKATNTDLLRVYATNTSVEKSVLDDTYITNRYGYIYDLKAGKTTTISAFWYE